jgi:hypothetical protein
MDKLVVALGPAFAAGFAVQHLLEVLSPLGEKFHWNNKIVLGGASLVLGFVLAFGTGLRVLRPLGITNADIWDALVSGLIISAGTEGLNSIMKFLGYAKEQKKVAMAAQK